MMEILFKGKEYPAIELYNLGNGWDYLLVSVESLEEELFNYWDYEARGIDDMIGFFVPDDVMNKGGDEVLKHVRDNLF